MEKNNKRVHWSASDQKTIEHKVFTWQLGKITDFLIIDAVIQQLPYSLNDRSSKTSSNVRPSKISPLTTL
jgi:hypothetical protein